jgi:flagellar basal body-associated protein FliL
MVSNLNEQTLTKYLSLELTLQTDAVHEDEVKAAIESRRPILTTWLTSHLADKTLDDIRGKVGVNRLRREIQDNFNSLLFSDGRERVQDVLFEEFHVQ